MAEVTSTNSEAVLSLPDGERLPRWLGWTRSALTRTPPALRRQVARLAWRYIASRGRLPAMVARYPDGRTFRIPAGDVMYAQVFVFGAYEPAETTIVERLLEPGDFAVDIGANHGWFSLLMGVRVGPAGAVWAVEPDGPIVEQLRANLGLNEGMPIEVKPFAVGDDDRVVDLHVFAGLPHGHASTSTLGRGDYVTHSVRQLALDRLLAEAPEPPVFIKVDVEGAELAVLQGANDLLQAGAPPIWMIEVNHQTAGAFGYRPRDLLTTLDEHTSHSVFRVVPDGLTPELDAAGAPHGTTWLCVPHGHVQRVSPLVAAAGTSEA